MNLIHNWRGKAHVNRTSNSLKVVRKNKVNPHENHSLKVVRKNKVNQNQNLSLKVVGKA
jgi:hypothetical protein